MAAAVKGVRAERARQTRRRMLHAAYDLFVEQGYPDTTMSRIAERAGVAVQTVHFTFGTKAELLRQVYDDAVAGDGEQADQRWYAEFRAAGELDTAVRILVENVQDVLTRTAPLDAFVRASSHRGESTRVREYTEGRRRRAWTGMVEHLTERFGLAPGLDRCRATDLLMLLMSPASYHTLVAEYGWSPAEWNDWCRDAVAAQLFGVHSGPGHP